MSKPVGGSLFSLVVALWSATACGSWDFEYGYKHVYQSNADDYVVDVSGLRKYSEWQNPPVTYWGPVNNDVPGSVTMRFDFDAPTSDVHARINLASFNFPQPGYFGSGKGSSSAWASTNGVDWQLLLDNPMPPRVDSYRGYDALLPDSLTGSSSLWLQVRLWVTEAPNSSYTTAQFSRSSAANPSDVFQIKARLAPPPEPSPDPATSLILNFGQNSSSNTVTAVNDGASPLATTTLSGTDVGITIAGNNLGLAPGAQAYLTFSATSTGPSSVAANGDFVQPYAGAFSIRSAVGGGGVNYLSGSFSDSVFGDGASLTLQASQPADAVGFTSDIPGAPIHGPRGLSWSLANLLPLASQSNNSLASFTASIAGNFTGAVPEPGTLAGLSLLSLGLGSRRSRGGRLRQTSEVLARRATRGVRGIVGKE